VPSRNNLVAARRAADRAHQTLGDDVRRQRQDAGLTRLELARAAGIDDAYLGRLERGVGRPSLDTYAKLAVVLGADLAARLYPNTGPLIRDQHRARITEALLELLHPRWQAYPEVAVRQPARGSIDLVLHAERERVVVTAEIQSELRRLEQLLRWSAAKAESLTSWEGWAHLGSVESRSQLLIVRSTRVTRQMGRDFAKQIASAFPAHPADAMAALTTPTGPWPGAALIWVDLRPEQIRFIRRR